MIHYAACRHCRSMLVNNRAKTGLVCAECMRGRDFSDWKDIRQSPVWITYVAVWK